MYNIFRSRKILMNKCEISRSEWGKCKGEENHIIKTKKEKAIIKSIKKLNNQEAKFTSMSKKSEGEEMVTVKEQIQKALNNHETRCKSASKKSEGATKMMQ
jgi:hypothetical protein